MKPKLTRWGNRTGRTLERLQQQFRRSRPGSVLIMVVALLVLLALMGTAYLSTARQDRIAAGLMVDNGLDAAVKQAANDTLSTAEGWLSSDQQTFTTTAIDAVPSTATQLLSGPLIASRQPDIVSLAGPGSDTSPFAVRWRHVTTPPAVGQYASPILWTGGATPNDQSYYNLSPSATNGIYWPIPTSMTVTYPSVSYGGSPELAGQTKTFPAFYKASFDPTNGTVNYFGPFLAADATGAGIANAGLFQLNVPAVDGVQFFAGVYIVDNAAAINVNTAWGPVPYPASTAYQPVNPPPAAASGNGAPTYTVNCDPAGNALNFFPTDVNLYGFLHSAFNQNDNNGASEMATLQARRASVSASGDYSQLYIDDANAAHADVRYMTRGEALWWSLGRRLDDPASQNLAGDPQQAYRRPFDDSDTVALGNRGVMVNAGAPASKIEEIFNGTSNQGDSIYRNAVNYMTNPQNQFNAFPANGVAYWYDWNYNFMNTAPQSVLKPTFTPAGAGGLPATIVPTLTTALDKLTLGVNLGTTTGNFSFRSPRSALTGSNPVKNLSRQTYTPEAAALAADPVVSHALGWPLSTQTLTGQTAIAGMTPTTMPAQSVDVQKVSLNTADFSHLWRAFANCFNDFQPEDGSSATEATTNGYYLHLHRDALGYELRDTAGPNSTASGTPVRIDATHPVSDPMQWRNVLRDPQLADSTSSGVTSPVNNTGSARAWLDSRNTAVLRAALAAVNSLTMRDQHGTMVAGGGTKYFAPNVNRAAISLDVKTDQAGTNQQAVTALVYGAAPQPYITEVYVDNDTSVHQSNGMSNLKGLVIVKLYNPYPYALSLANYEIAVIDRSKFNAPSAGGMTVTPISRTAGSALIPATTTIAANGYLILTNYVAGTGYWPQLVAGQSGPLGAPVVIDGLSDCIGGTGVGPANGGEMLLLRPLAADVVAPNVPPTPAGGAAVDYTRAEVPVDSFDFTNMKIDATGKFSAWHYLRMSGNANDPAGTTPPRGTTTLPASVAWKCVYPGAYSGTGDFTAAATNNPPATPASTVTLTLRPHFQGTDAAEWDPQAFVNPWDQGATGNKSLSVTNASPTFHLDLVTSPASTAPNPFPGIQICNVDFGGSNKRDPAETRSVFPYGGFARVGDVLQVPFVGSYVILPPGGQWPPVAGANAVTPTVTEVNPVTLDTCFADDGDKNDDGVEQLGRFAPIVSGANLNDLNPSGYYAAAQSTMAPRLSYANAPYLGIAPPAAANWRYHFALEVYNQFTVVSSPGNDLFPNFSPDSWYVPTGGAASLVPNGISNGGATGVEGLINVNTADWRTLAAVEMFPATVSPSGAATNGLTSAQVNAWLAQAIVRYRDYDDGQLHYAQYTQDASGNFTPVVATKFTRGHGPFNSLAELNAVFDPTDHTVTFQNAFGNLPSSFASETTRHTWGYYSPGAPGSTVTTNTLQNDDWLANNLMVDRVSNLLTTRSDSFTVYVVVQGWRNAFKPLASAVPPTNPQTSGPWPELVVQKRVAVTVDRSGVTSLSKSLRTNAFPTK